MRSRVSALLVACVLAGGLAVATGAQGTEAPKADARGTDAQQADAQKPESQKPEAQKPEAPAKPGSPAKTETTAKPEALSGLVPATALGPRSVAPGARVGPPANESAKQAPGAGVAAPAALEAQVAGARTSAAESAASGAPTPTSAPTQDPPPPGGAEPAPPAATLAPPTERERRSIALLRSACEELARAYPRLCELRSLGQSRNGLEIPLAVIGDTAAGNPARRPALFVCAELAPSEQSAPDALVRAISELLARAATQPETAELLRTRTIYVVPAPDPDHWYEPDPELAIGGPRRVELDRNFPAGWKPQGRGGGVAGPYPLSENESGALARFLRGAGNVAAVLLAPGREEVLGSRPAEARVRPDTEADRAPARAGSFERFCAEQLGAPVLRPGTRLPKNVREDVAASLAGPSAADPLAAILRALPDLAFNAARVERLRANVWLVDLALTNTGAFATGEGVWLASSGARVVSVTLRAGESAPWRSVRGPAPWALGEIAGGASIALRWIVEGEEGTELVLALDSRRAGVKEARVVLR